MRKFLQKYLVLIVVILAIILLFQKINWLPSFKNIFKSQPVLIDEIVMDTAKIGNGMPSLLPTAVGTILTPAIDKLVIIGRGKVLAGTDLKNIQDKDIQVTGDSIYLILPHAKILQTIMNPSDFETFDEKGNWDDKAVIALKSKIRNEINIHALQQNILQQADTRCKNIIETFLKNTGFKKVQIDLKN